MSRRGFDHRIRAAARQLIAALTKLDADVAGLIELENTDGTEPLADIVDGLNAQLGTGTYAYIDTGTIGGDAIKVGLIYKPGVVVPVGTYKILDSGEGTVVSSIPKPSGVGSNLPANRHRRKLTVVVNHLKSRAPTATMSATRIWATAKATVTSPQAALALIDWLNGDPTGSGDPDFLILGDLNAYAKEDPVRVLEEAGYVDLAPKFLAPMPTPTCSTANGAHSITRWPRRV